MKVYKNFKELSEEKENLSQELLQSVGEGDWQEREIIYFNELEDYAYFELTEGWYAEAKLDSDWKGAPDLLSFIDTYRLGRSLSQLWDTSAYFLSESEEVLTSPYGW